MCITIKPGGTRNVLYGIYKLWDIEGLFLKQVIIKLVDDRLTKNYLTIGSIWLKPCLQINAKIGFDDVLDLETMMHSTRSLWRR